LFAGREMPEWTCRERLDIQFAHHFSRPYDLCFGKSLVVLGIVAGVEA
jgi:hypothetical protein